MADADDSYDASDFEPDYQAENVKLVAQIKQLEGRLIESEAQLRAERVKGRRKESSVAQAYVEVSFKWCV